MGCFQQEWDEELLRSQEEYYSDEDEFLSGLHDIDEAMHYIEEECDREYDRRSVIVRNGLERAKRLLDGIDDPHWHRMKQNYLQTTAPGAQEDCVPERLQQMLNAEINRLDMLTGRLQSAFIPPSGFLCDRTGVSPVQTEHLSDDCGNQNQNTGLRGPYHAPVRSGGKTGVCSNVMRTKRERR